MGLDHANVRQTVLPKDIFIPDWFIWLCALLCVWPGLGAYGVLNNNEGLYATIPMEMLRSGDVYHWIIPHLNGLPYLEKPPLMYWLTAVSFSIFGYAEWVVRLVPTLAGLACVGLLLNFGRRIAQPLVGRLAAFMFISGLGVTLVSRTLVFDMLLTAFVTGALLHAYLYLIQEKKRDLYIATACLALGVLTKGFVAMIIVGLVVIAWMILLYGASMWRRIIIWFDPLAIGLFFAIAAPWFIAASWMEPIFPWFFFINEHVLRFIGLRIPHDYYSGPWWYYLPRLIIYLFPWSLLVPMLWMSRTSAGKVDAQELVTSKKMWMLGWLAPLAFFSLSNAKANYYLVVAMPFAALHLASMLEQKNFLHGKKASLLGIILAVIAGGIAFTLQFMSGDMLPDLVASRYGMLNLVFLGMPLATFVLALLWTFAGLSMLAAVVSWRIPKVGLLAYVVLPWFLAPIGVVVVDGEDAFLSDRSLATFIEQTVPNRTVYLYRNFEQNSSLPFYLQKSLNIIDSSSNDLYWGDKLRPANSIMISQKQFDAEKNPRVVVVPNAYLDEFVHKKLHTKFVHSKQFGYATLLY